MHLRLYVFVIFPVSVDRFLPNFGHWCILGQRLIALVLVLKDQGHIIAAKASSTRCCHRVQVSSFNIRFQRKLQILD